eukprot:5979251-Pyramimonas_sp.AAC.1
MALSEAQEFSVYQAWAGRRIIDLGLFASESEVGRRRSPAPGALPSIPTPFIGDETGHQLFYSPSRGEWRCRQCNTVTKSRAGLHSLQVVKKYRVCKPSDIQRWAAQRLFNKCCDFVPQTSEGAEAALSAASRLLDGPPPPDPAL